MTGRLLLSLEGVHLSFGGKPLFEGVSLHAHEGDAIALVGRNGAGKTTLMRLIMGEIEPDQGRRFAIPGLRVGYLAQTVKADLTMQVGEFVRQGLLPEERDEGLDHLADRVLEPLGLDASARMGALSGGQNRRAGLARALVAKPDVLLLDEPTNHLDLHAIEWLESTLSRYRGAVMVVSHDRAFLNQVSRRVFWMDRGIVRSSDRGYQHFEAWSEAVLEQEAREIQNNQKKLQAEVDWTQGGVTGRRKRNQRRLAALHQLRAKLKADKARYQQQTRSIALEPLSATQASSLVCEFDGVSKAYSHAGGEVPILRNFNFRLMRGDRLGVLGRNGSGKSTFLKLLMGEIAPDHGSVTRGKTVDISYFDQNRVAIDPDKRVCDMLCPDGGDYVVLGQGEKQRTVHVRGYLKDFLFDPAILHDKVGTLSGGQQNRLMLARMLAKPSNVMILDEPTNDLDMDTLDMLQEILADYAGTLVLVSHDRDFLDRTVSSVLAFEGDARVDEVVGGYSDYLTFRKQHPLKQAAVVVVEKTKPSAPSKPPASKRLGFKEKYELANLPSRIADLEAAIAGLQAQLDDPNLYSHNPRAYAAATEDLAQLQQELDAAETRWLELDGMV